MTSTIEKDFFKNHWDNIQSIRSSIQLKQIQQKNMREMLQTK